MPDVRLSPSGITLPPGFVGVEVRDQGIPQGVVTVLNFVGAGVSAVVVGNVATISIPGGGVGGVTVSDGDGNVVPGATTLNVPIGLIGSGPPGVAELLQAPVRVTDAFGNDAIYRQLNFANMFAGAGAPGVCDVFGLTPPTAPEARFAAYATTGGGDLEYAPSLRFDSVGPDRVPTFYGAGVYPRFDNSLGFTVFRFNPPVAPAGPPWFGTGNGFLWRAQDAAPGSGLAGGDMGIQAGDGRAAGGTGGTAYVQAGGNPDVASDRGVAELRASGGSGVVRVGGPNGNALAFFAGVPEAQITVVGSRGGNAALASLLAALDTYGLIIDSTTP